MKIGSTCPQCGMFVYVNGHICRRYVVEYGSHKTDVFATTPEHACESFVKHIIAAWEQKDLIVEGKSYRVVPSAYIAFELEEKNELVQEIGAVEREADKEETIPNSSCGVDKSSSTVP